MPRSPCLSQRGATTQRRVTTTVPDNDGVDARNYDVYGAVRAGGAGTRHKFCGRLGHASDDETGLVYMRARYMGPGTGRFTTGDPAQDGANWYVYASNNPVRMLDADGRATIQDDLVSIFKDIVAMVVCSYASPRFRDMFICWALSMAMEIGWYIDARLGRGTGGMDAGAILALLSMSVLALGPSHFNSAKDWANGVTPSAVQVGAFFTGYAAMLEATSKLLDIEAQLL